MQHLLATIEEVLTATSDITLLTQFHQTDTDISGQICLAAAPKPDLRIEVNIPLTYPYLHNRKCSSFRCLNATGYRHLNADNSVCLEVPFVNSVAGRLRAELAALLVWRDQYYRQTPPDERYEYPILPNVEPPLFLFTQTTGTYRAGESGEFDFMPYGENVAKEPVSLVSSIGGNPCAWSRGVIQAKDNRKGLYYVLPQEPIQYGTIAKSHWRQLTQYVSQAFLQRLMQWPKGDRELYVFLGYFMPGSSEIHWLAARIDPKKPPVEAGKRINRFVPYAFSDQPIRWCHTQNISRERFFGRGSLTPLLTEKKILIVGIGAIGSMLAKMLTRSGASFIRLIDYEVIEPGNLCRSEFFLLQVGMPKMGAIAYQLRMISPFVDVGVDQLLPLSDAPSAQQLACQQLAGYDLIFDCTANNEICSFLDSLKLTIPVINFSLTNGANELVCGISTQHVVREVAQLFKNLPPKEMTLVYEGQGCWHPTFAASYVDVSALVSAALKNIHFRLHHQLPLNSFIVQVSEESNYQTLKIIGY